jgi:hypothetical protein
MLRLGCYAILDDMGGSGSWDPGDPRNRERIRGSWRQARRLLMEWDPIGVSDVSEATDEYDCMIGPILHRLFDGADAHSLAQWISHERTNHFGLAPDQARDNRLAEALAAWWQRRRSSNT